MSFVVDSSVALSWCFEDERTQATRALLERVGEAGAIVPQHWPAEVLNGLMMAERRQRIDAGRRRKLAEFLHDLPLAIDPETTVQRAQRKALPNASASRSTTRSTLSWRNASNWRSPRSIRTCAAPPTTVGVPVLGSRSD